MGLAEEGWILRRQDPEECLMLHLCRGHPQIRTLMVLCRKTEAGVPATVRFSVPFEILLFLFLPFVVSPTHGFVLLIVLFSGPGTCSTSHSLP